MIEITIREVVEAVGGNLVCGDQNIVFKDISTDSRKIVNGCLYIPIVGEKFDGNDFCEEAVEKGAAAFLTSRKGFEISNATVVEVEDTIVALQSLANYVIKKSGIPVVAVTGSVGKTSTKEMIASVLSEKFNVLKTEGNFNNDIGVPLTVFSIEPHHQIAVIEMGMSGLGEIDRLSKIVEPNIAVITNIGVSHIEKLGSRENIFKAKMEIVNGLKIGGVLVVNADDEYLTSVTGNENYEALFVGIEKNCELRAEDINLLGEEGVEFTLKHNGEYDKIHISVPGRHNVLNALVAVAVGFEMGLTIEQITRGLDKYRPAKMRQDIIEVGGIKIINDTYNASPQSMKASIEVLSLMKRDGRSIAILGDMLELGEWSMAEHTGVGEYVAKSNVDILVTLGKCGEFIAKGATECGMDKSTVYTFFENSQVNEFLQTLISKGDRVLVKGSRGMKMEEIVKAICSMYTKVNQVQ